MARVVKNVPTLVLDFVEVSSRRFCKSTILTVQTDTHGDKLCSFPVGIILSLPL